MLGFSHRSRRHSKPLRSRLSLEALEDRRVPATYYWAGAADTYPIPGNNSSWSDSRNWDLNGQLGVGIPGAGDVAAFSNTVPLYHWPDGTTSTHPHNTGPVYDVAGGGTVGAISIDSSWAPGENGYVAVTTPLTITGTSEWDSGRINIATGVTLTNSGSLTMNNSIASYPDNLQGDGTLVNAPEATLTNAGTNGLDFGFGYGNYPILDNQPGGTINLASDGGIFSDWAGGYFTNAGTSRKTVGAGGTASSTIRGITFSNSGTIDVEQGVLKNEGIGNLTPNGVSTGGTFIVAAGATLDLTGSDAGLGAPLQYQGTYTGYGCGTILLGSGSGLRLTGDTQFNFPGNLFQWTGGDFGTEGYLDTNGYTLTNLGVMSLTGSGYKPLLGNGTLINAAGAVINQSGTGSLGLGVGGPQYSPVTLANAGLYDIMSDASVGPVSYGGVINNTGTIRKSGGTGTSVINPRYSAPGSLNNTGTIAALSGTLDVEGVAQVSGSTLTGGTWEAVAPGTLKINNGVALTSNAATVSLIGAGATFVNFAGHLAANSATLSLAGGKMFTATSGYSQSATGSLAVRIGDATQSGQLDVTGGTVSLGGSLSIMAGFVFPPATQFVIIDNDTGSPVQGTFANLPEGKQFAASGGIYSISYHGGDGNDVVLKVIEPLVTPFDIILPPVQDFPTLPAMVSEPTGQIFI